MLLEDRNKLESKEGKETLKHSVFLDFFFLARELFFLVVVFFVCGFSCCFMLLRFEAEPKSSCTFWLYISHIWI